MKEYALYRGDTFIDLGTTKELAEKHNITPKTIRWLATCERWKNREHKNGMIVIPIEED